MAGSLRSSLGLERIRLDRIGEPRWTWRNDILNAWAMTMTVVLFAALVAGFGLIVLPYLLLQAVVGFSLLEVVNYLEHYGLLRQKRDDGRYERCAPEHSWSSNNVASNVLLYHLQRHSDHHANPMRLPGPASLRPSAAAAHRLRGHDRAGLRPTAVATRHGPSRPRALRR